MGAAAGDRQARPLCFGETVEPLSATAIRLPVQAVVGVERTRATFLSLGEHDQADFAAGLSGLLEPGTGIPPDRYRYRRGDD